MLLSLSGAVRQKLLEQALFQLQPRLELLSHLTGPDWHLTGQNRSHILQRCMLDGIKQVEKNIDMQYI